MYKLIYNNRIKLFTPLNWFSFIIVAILVLYSLKWSNLFEDFSPLVLGALVLICLGSIVVSWLFTRNIPNDFTAEVIPLKSWYIIGFLFTCFITDIIQYGSIPLVDIFLLNKQYHYRFFHQTPFFSTIYSVIGAYFAILFLRNWILGRKTSWLFFVLCLVPFIIVINRSIIVIVLMVGFFSFFLIKKLRWNYVLIFTAVIVVLSFVFGVIGNVREMAKKPVVADEYIDFNSISKLSSRYPSSLPDEFMWSYIYMASPIANFNHNVINNPTPKNNFSALFIHEMLPLSFSFRLNNVLQIEERKALQVSPKLTASSYLTYPYTYAGWYGVGMISGLLFMIVFLYYKFAQYTGYVLFDVGVGIITCFCVLCCFDNMVSFNFLWLLITAHVLHVFYSIMVRNRNIEQ